MFDPDHERSIFAAQTASLELYSDLSQAYSRTRLFRLDALELLSPQFDTDMWKWLDVARDVSHGRATEGARLAARIQILEYRAQRLGLLEFDDELSGPADALTRLFMFALDEWPRNPEEITEGGVFVLLDHFTDLFLAGFGRASELAQTLKRRFGL